MPTASDSIQGPRATVRRIASAMVPAAGKRMIDAARNRYGMSIMSPANREFVRRHGLCVSGGPFAGMQYLQGLESTQGDLVGKLLGSYESELHPALWAWQAEDLSTILNVGCAEGYYAVGLALGAPAAVVLAYDIDPVARQLCERLARLNHVEDRISIHGQCTPAVLTTLPSDGVALFCDCEGYEKTLLDPEAAPVLRGWRIIVELHDFVDPTITDTICERFAGTHEIELLDSTPPSVGPPPQETAFMSERQRRLVLNERPVSMRWASLTPRP